MKMFETGCHSTTLILYYRTYNKIIIMETKKCSKCKTENPATLEYFYANSGTKLNLSSWCKECLNSPEMKEYRKKWLKKWRKGAGKEQWNAYVKKWKSENRDKANNFVYDWAKKNIDDYVNTQKKYQQSIPPAVYSVTYKDEIVYIGSTNEPNRRKNVHLSTIKTKNNIGKINKLHSFLNYDKADFKFNIVEHCDTHKLIEREQFYEDKFKAKEKYKEIFGKVEKTGSIIQRLELTSSERNSWR